MSLFLPPYPTYTLLLLGNKLYFKLRKRSCGPKLVIREMQAYSEMGLWQSRINRRQCQDRWSNS